jgi:DNA polymerase-1
MAREKPLLLLIDGHAMVHRAWHGIPQPMIARAAGEDVRGVYGFANTFLRTINDWKPSYCAIAFDLPGPTFRHREYKPYKAHRPELTSDLKAQFPRVKQLMEAFGVPIFEVNDYEADDVLGTLSRLAEEQGLETLILTGDTDTLQLVTPWVRVLMHLRVQDKVVYDENGVRGRYGGLQPTQQPDIKALQGDSSDNIPGVPSVGNKTAIKLIQNFGSLEGVYERLDEVIPPRLQQTLRDFREQAIQGKLLTTIVTDLPLTLDLEATRFGGFSRERVLEFLRELEFNSLVNRVPQIRSEDLAFDTRRADLSENFYAAGPDYRTVDTAQVLSQMVHEMRSAGTFAFDVETDGRDPVRQCLVGISFSAFPGRAYYIPVGHREGTQLSLRDVISGVKPLLEDPALAKIGHNANFDMTVLSNYDVRTQNVIFDTMVAAQLIGHNTLGLKALAFQLLNQDMTPIQTLIGTGKKQITMAEVAIQIATPYAAADADMTGRLYRLFKDQLPSKGVEYVFSQVEMPLVPVIVQMQINGILLKTDHLIEMSERLGERILCLVEDIYNVAGKEFNVNSPQQLGAVLFENLLPASRLKELRLPSPKRTATGYSTDATILEELRGAHPIVAKVLEYRQLSKLKSTYLDALPGLVNPNTGRLHTSYNQVGSSTGRISSRDPNLQNIPIRDDLGRQVRRAFIAQKGWRLLAADYSQVELRVLAHLSQDPGLLAAFGRDEDIHASTASLVYGVPLQQVTREMRRMAKVMNFGVVYGLSAHGIAQQTDISFEEGNAFIQGYFGKYPGIRAYLDATKQQAYEHGYVETVLGRRRPIPGIASSNYQVRQAAERMAVNMPVQGGAADIIKIAMIRIHHWLRENNMQSRMLLQVHDELIFEVPDDEMDTMRSMAQHFMPKALDMRVPLKVDIKTGYNWGDLE